jgi:hypothetical protein
MRKPRRIAPRQSQPRLWRADITVAECIIIAGTRPLLKVVLRPKAARLPLRLRLKVVRLHRLLQLRNV